MRIAVAGKGGVGKTTVSGTVARELARSGRDVLALDVDRNPMLGISLGLGPEETELVTAVRERLNTGEVDHQPTPEGIIEAFGRDAPDGVRLVVVSRIDNIDPGCPCCGVSPEQILGQLESCAEDVVCDLEAGVGMMLRLQPGQVDLVLVVADPSAKAIDVAQRAAAIASASSRVIVIANRIREEADLAAMRDALGDFELVEVPEDAAICDADRDGLAPLDVGSDSPAVLVLRGLAQRLSTAAAATSN